MTTARVATGGALDRGLAALMVLGGLVTATPYAARAVGLVVDVPARLEVIDHVVPGLVVVASATLALLLRQRLAPVTVAIAVAATVLAGIWTTTTHVPLLAQAAKDLVTWPAALFHSLPGLALLATATATLVPLLREPR